MKDASESAREIHVGAGAGLASLAQGLRLLFAPGLRRFVILPFVFNAALFAAVLGLGAPAISGWLEGLLPDWLKFLHWIVWPVVVFAALLVVFVVFTPVANLLAAPFNGLLADRIALRLGRTPAQGKKGVVSIVRSMSDDVTREARKLAWFVLRAVPLGLLFLIPGLNVAAPFLWFAFSAWYLAMEYLDYPLTNTGLDFDAQRRWRAKRRAATAAFGASASVLTLLPVLNFLAMPAAVAGATVLWSRTQASGD